MDPAQDPVRRYLDRHRPQMAEELTRWVRLPSVAGVPERFGDVVRSAHWLAAAFRETGFPDVQVWSKDTAPAVFARWTVAADKPTVLVYSHHDVRDVKPELWTQTAPFEPVQQGNRLYGRGASDAKGQVMAHLWATRALLAADEPLPVNLTFLVEGEEETGSAHLAELMERHRDQLRADLVVFSDTMLWHAEHPAVCQSLRGMLSAELKVFGPLRDVHSGAVSGLAPNPVAELSRLLAALYDENQRIAVPGFYDPVLDPDTDSRAGYHGVPFDPQDWLARTGTRTITGESGFGELQRLWARPAIEVTSFIAGDHDMVARGIIPHVATTQLSIRMVPDQKPAEVADQLRRWAQKQIRAGYGHELTFEETTAQEPYCTAPGHPALGWLAEAMGQAFGKPVGRMGNAGTGPAQLLADSTGAQVLFFGTGLPEDCWHDADESVDLDVLTAGAHTLALFWQRAGREGRIPG